ncbi:hypothetical protein, partial [Massilia antarctica]|uniref:hypothetical protein n=1 Tax=Massilia antarctica TaxID=2765360 RepID=UPI0035F0B010
SIPCRQQEKGLFQLGDTATVVKFHRKRHRANFPSRILIRCQSVRGATFLHSIGGFATAIER